MKQVAAWIKEAIESKGSPETLSNIKGQVKELCHRFPVYGA
jgi:glycine/serine hydroxymethyltransferase